jgi:hypothetical protein
MSKDNYTPDYHTTQSETIFPAALLATCFHASFLLGLFFNPQDGHNMLLQNVS